MIHALDPGGLIEFNSARKVGLSASSTGPYTVIRRKEELSHLTHTYIEMEKRRMVIMAVDKQYERQS
jgi:hypothetical protein